MIGLPRVELKRPLNASAERVFAAFANAAAVAKWLTPSPDVKLTVLEFDFREGGRYRFAYDTPAQEHMLVSGVYRSIEAPRLIVFSWLIEPPDPHAGIESQVTVQIAARGAAAELSIWHERFERADANARHAQGWAGALDQLEQLLPSAAWSQP